MAGFSPSIPLRRDSENGFALNTDMAVVIAQNLKNLIMTSPGERVMLPSFGVGIRNFVFEPNLSSTYGTIRARINEQIADWMPFISIEDIGFNTDENNENYVNIQITYTITPLDYTDVLSLTV